MNMYLVEVQEFFTHYGLYVPPLHTLRSDKPLGSWYYRNDFPPQLRQTCLDVSALLRRCFRDKYTGLTKLPEHEQIVNHGTCGYDIYSSLAALENHPSLNPFASSTVSEPFQRADMSVITYCQRWCDYLARLAIGGTYFSDRYFLSRFLHSMHRMFKDRIEGDINSLRTQFQWGTPLPGSLAPDRLHLRIQMLYKSYGLEKTLSKTPRELQNATRVIREIHFAAEQEEDEAYVAALNTDIKCHICGKNHFASTCPVLDNLLKHPAAARKVGYELSKTGRGSGARDGSNARRGRMPPSQDIRALTNGDDTPFIEELDDNDSLADASLVDAGEGTAPDDELAEVPDFQ